MARAGRSWRMRWSALPCLLVGAWACAPAAQETPEPTRVRRGAETVVLVVVESWRPDHLPSSGYRFDTMPRFGELAREAVLFDEHYAVVTGTNAALASLLTGRRPREHGVSSIKERGAQALDESNVTLAERFREAGFQTLAFTSLPQLGRPLSGLDQGFDHYAFPAAGEISRSASQTWWSARPELDRALASEQPVFVLLHFADPGRLQDGSIENRMRFLAQHLEPFRAEASALDGALQVAAREPERAWEEVERLVQRGRGSPEYEALQDAKYDGQLAAVDLELGHLLDLLRERGRFEDALICVVGTRGTLLGEAPDPSGPAFPRPLVRTPLLVRFPGGTPARRVGGLVQSTWLFPTLDDVLGWDRLEITTDQSLLPMVETGGAGASEVLCQDAGLERRAAFTARLHVEDHPVLGTALFDERGTMIRSSDLETDDDRERAEALVDALERIEVAAEWIVQAGGAPGRDVIVRWRFTGGRTVDVRGEGDARDEGSVELGEGKRASSSLGGSARMGAGATLTVFGSRRGLPMELCLEQSDGDLPGDAPGLDEALVLAGSEPLDRSLLPRLPVPEAEPWPVGPDGEPHPAPVRFEHSGESWWRLSVAATADAATDAAPTEAVALLCLYPPGPLDEELLWSADVEVRVEPVAGRLDAILARAIPPFDLQVQKLPSREIGLAVTLDGVAVPVAEIAMRGKRLGSQRALRLYVPDWMPGITDSLDERGARSGELAPDGLRLSRGGALRAPQTRTPLDHDHLEFVRRLGAYE